MPNIGDVLDGKVVKILRDGAIVKLSTGGTGFLHISEISKEYIKNINDHLQVGKEVKVKVIEIKGTKVSLSIRKIHNFNPVEEKRKRFEKSLENFLKVSGEKQKQIQKGIESKQGVKKRVEKAKKQGN